MLTCGLFRTNASKQASDEIIIYLGYALAKEARAKQTSSTRAALECCRPMVGGSGRRESKRNARWSELKREL